MLLLLPSIHLCRMGYFIYIGGGSLLTYWLCRICPAKLTFRFVIIKIYKELTLTVYIYTRDTTLTVIIFLNRFVNGRINTVRHVKLVIMNKGCLGNCLSCIYFSTVLVIGNFLVLSTSFVGALIRVVDTFRTVHVALSQANCKGN